jgi:ABC-type uncharacterized transport system substrate-binding protein
MKRVIEIVETSTRKVVTEIDVSERGARETERIERGVNRNLDHERFFTRIAPPLPAEKGSVDR